MVRVRNRRCRGREPRSHPSQRTRPPASADGAVQPPPGSGWESERGHHSLAVVVVLAVRGPRAGDGRSQPLAAVTVVTAVDTPGVRTRGSATAITPRFGTGVPSQYSPTSHRRSQGPSAPRLSGCEHGAPLPSPHACEWRFGEESQQQSTAAGLAVPQVNPGAVDLDAFLGLYGPLTLPR